MKAKAQVSIMRPKYKSNRGITLMEMMITTVIISIAAAMAVPKFQIAFERLKFNAANRDIINTMRMARSQAITEKAQYGVVFNDTSKTVIFFKDLVNTAGIDFVSGDSIVSIDTLPREFTYMATDVTNNVFLFRPNGSAKFLGGGNLWTIAYTDDIVAVQQSQITSSTGRVDSYSNFY
jgi:prepilin-type N-terminal cleavage/methylation domain-containing protein